ncbi:MAG: transposase [Bacteroidetes bacterium]|nr:MAG: transposase [Bacteroidota bacterium]
MKNGKRLIKRRKFSEEFKRTIVSEYESGKFTIMELSKLHALAHQCIYRWIYKYSSYNTPQTQVVEMKNSSQHKLKKLEDRIKELEGIVGRKQIEIDYLEALIKVAEKELNVDIKKNSGTQRSTTSEPGDDT